MKYKYTGEQDEITLRNTTFAKGKAVDLSDNPGLAQKVSVLPEFEAVKPKGKANDAD